MPINGQYGWTKDTYALRNLTDPTVNESNLTLDELTKRLQAFQQLGKTQGVVDKGTLDRALDQSLNAMGVQSDVAGLAKPLISQWIQEHNAFPDAPTLQNLLTAGVYTQPSGHFVEDNGSLLGKIGGGLVGTAVGSTIGGGLGGPIGAGIGADLGGKATSGQGGQLAFNQIPGGINPIMNWANDQDTRNNFSNLVSSMVTAPDVSSDLTRIQGLIHTQNQNIANQNSLNSYISGLPDTLASQENQMLDAYTQAQNQNFQDVLAPQMLSSANARGALFSGDAGDMLATGYGNIQGQRDALQSQMMAEDNQFYFNAAYQNSLNQQLQGQKNYADFLQGEQQRVMQSNANQFQTNQAQLSNVNQQNLMQQQYQNQLKAYQQQMKMQQEYQSNQNRANMWGSIGQTIGGIGMTALGAYTGNPYLIAGGIGNTAGGVPGIATGVGGH